MEIVQGQDTHGNGRLACWPLHRAGTRRQQAEYGSGEQTAWENGGNDGHGARLSAGGFWMGRGQIE
ncbi:hypothetical protein GCM10027296_01870 [Chitinimonas naiadis]